MCSYIVEKARLLGSAKGPSGWMRIDTANVYYDHPFHAPLDHALGIDFISEADGGRDRVAVELSAASARELVAKILAALANGALSLVERFLSSSIGEGLIFDLRSALFGHVQRMPIGFFTRTQTGALISRMNNDVIGAQRAFTSTLSGTVSNAISVVVVGITMFALSWQVTLACLALFPLLLLASRWVGRQISGLTRNQMDGNADLGNLMTERFNVGGALLLKLFGRRDEEDAKYAEKAGLVRDLGIRIDRTVTGGGEEERSPPDGPPPAPPAHNG